MNEKYHIDVTPEEDTLYRDNPRNKKDPQNFSLFKNPIFWIVVCVHLGVFSVFAIDVSPKKDTIDVQTPIVKSTPTPNPTPLQTPLPEPVSPINQVTPIVPNKTNNLTKEYVIKQGDTIHSIAKKYKLNYDRLLKMNNIQDPNKIIIGQKLKFL